MELMKIAFTTKEYARLLELAYLGQAVVDGRMETDEKRSERYEELVQKLLSLAEAHGCADLAESAKPTPAELEKLESLAERYWAELEKNGIDHLQLLRGGRG